MASPMRPMPEDFPERARKETFYQLRIRYKTGASAIQRWLDDLGMKRFLIVAPEPPRDFKARAKGRSILAVAKEMGHTEYQIKVWFKRFGLVSKRGLPGGLEKVTRTPASAPAKSIDAGKIGWNPVAIPARDDSIAGEAADFLRRKGWVVFRARTLKAAANKNDWIVGRLTLGTGAMIAKATDKGFQARSGM